MLRRLQGSGLDRSGRFRRGSRDWMADPGGDTRAADLDVAGVVSPLSKEFRSARKEREGGGPTLRRRRGSSDTSGGAGASCFGVSGLDMEAPCLIVGLNGGEAWLDCCFN